MSGVTLQRSDRLLGNLGRWAMENSLWFFPIATGCCADETLNLTGARYDLERFGCLPQEDPEQADVLIVTGVATARMAPEIRDIYERMKSPKYVLAIGSCACSGGLFSGPNTKQDLVLPGLREVIPVDVFVPGCPPRPEAIMHGLIKLKEIIRGHA